jgi:hypothetical protein
MQKKNTLVATDRPTWSVGYGNLKANKRLLVVMDALTGELIAKTN